MSRKETWRNVLIILAILVGTALVTAVWPLLTTSPEGRIPAPAPEVPMLEINVPPFLVNALGINSPLIVNGFIAVAVLAALIIGAVVVMGGGLAFLYTLLTRQTVAIEASEEFKANQAALEQREAERIKRLRAERKPAPMPSHKMPRWSAVSTSLAILLFVVFFGFILNSVFFPHGEIIVTLGNVPRIINSAWFVVGGLVLLTLPFLLWYIRPARLEQAESTDNAGVPWDFIAVLLTGLLVVGLGIGFVVYLNIPASG